MGFIPSSPLRQPAGQTFGGREPHVRFARLQRLVLVVEREEAGDFPRFLHHVLDVGDAVRGELRVVAYEDLILDDPPRAVQHIAAVR